MHPFHRMAENSDDKLTHLRLRRIGFQTIESQKVKALNNRHIEGKTLHIQLALFFHQDSHNNYLTTSPLRKHLFRFRRISFIFEGNKTDVSRGSIH